MIKWLFKLCLVIVITLSALIAIKQNNKVKNILYDNVYNSNISFSYLNKLYKKYLGDNILFENKLISKPVFSEKLLYTSKEKYKDGLKLNVDSNYLIPSLDAGLVVFVGEKDEYGYVVIVEQVDGVDVWYGNLNNVNVKLYDYIDKGFLIGDCTDYFYLIHKKNGEFIDYNDKI